MKRREFYKQLLPRLEKLLQEAGFARNDITDKKGCMSDYEWIRRRGPYVHSIGLESSRSRPECWFTVGLDLDFLPHSGEYYSSKAHMRRFFRPGRGGVNWRFEDGESAVDNVVESVASDVLSFLDRYCDFPYPFSEVTPENLDDFARQGWFPDVFGHRLYLMMARVSEHLGKIDQAKEYCDIGIYYVDPRSLGRSTPSKVRNVSKHLMKEMLKRLESQ